MSEFMDTVRDRLATSIEVKQRMLDDETLLGEVGNAAQMLLSCFRGESGTVFLAGNGGSACDAQHLAGELVGRFYLNRPGVPAITLGVNPAISSALGNDFSYTDALARELDALAVPGDLFVGFSTSGNSKNIVRCLEVCREMGIHSIGFTGRDGGNMKNLCDVLIRVPSTDTPRIQESHITLGHVICEIVEKELFPKST